MQMDDSSLAPVHRVSKAPRVEQPVVAAVRKPFSNNNENILPRWWDQVQRVFLNWNAPFLH